LPPAEARSARSELERPVVDDRSGEAGTLAGCGLAVVAGKSSGPPPCLRCQLFGDDQVYRHDDLVVEAGARDPCLPDPRLVGEDESGGFHHVAQWRNRTEECRVEHDVCIGRERLVSLDATGGAEVDGLGANEYDGIEV